MFQGLISAPLTLAAFATALAGCDDAQTLSRTDGSGAAQAGSATSILNAGVMTELGEARAKLLFDPLYDDHFGSLEELPPDLIEAIVTGAAPYDGVDAVFVSHAHGDHFSASQLTGMLAAQRDLVLVAPAQAIGRMREDNGWEAGFDARVRAIALENGEASEAFTFGGVNIEAFRSPHTGWPERHAEVHNISFRVSAPAGDGLHGRVMHLGDADPAAEHYAILSEFFEAHRTSLAMVPYWHYGTTDFADLLEGTFNAEAAVAMHVPRSVPRELSEGDRPYFSQVGEMVEIVAVR
ncbi:MAG: MBL fold metallo-hydrolase [Erythrobacter sp.]